MQVQYGHTNRHGDSWIYTGMRMHKFVHTCTHTQPIHSHTQVRKYSYASLHIRAHSHTCMHASSAPAQLCVVDEHGTHTLASSHAEATDVLLDMLREGQLPMDDDLAILFELVLEARHQGISVSLLDALHSSSTQVRCALGSGLQLPNDPALTLVCSCAWWVPARGVEPEHEKSNVAPVNNRHELDSQAARNDLLTSSAVSP